MKYFNIRTNYGVETIDQIDTKDFKTISLFNKELNRLRREYHLCGMNVYTSQKACKDWNKK